MVDAMLRCQLRQRQVTPDRFQRHLCLELRAVALPRLLHFPSIPQVGISLAPCPNFRDHLTGSLPRFIARLSVALICEDQTTVQLPDLVSTLPSARNQREAPSACSALW